MSAWQAWLDYLKRSREQADKRREQGRDDTWRRTGKEYNADMKGWKGQGIIEYAVIIGLVLLVVVVMGVLIHNQMYASCDDLGYLSLKDLPARCLIRVTSPR